MKETKTIYKLFWVWDFEKEEKWLNEMAMQGWALAAVVLCRYTFERCEPEEYTIRLEMHDYDTDYISFMEEIGAEYVGSLMKWKYFRRRSEYGSFDLFSDIDSRIEHLSRIHRTLLLIGIGNLMIGIGNSLNPRITLGWINLLCATLLMYGCGRIKGKLEYLENERITHE